MRARMNPIIMVPCAAFLMTATPASAEQLSPACKALLNAPNVSEASAVNSYTVHRNESPIGTHTIRFYVDGDNRLVEAETFMKVKVLFIRAFSYHYRSRELWCGGELRHMHTVTDDNGTDYETTITRTPVGYTISKTVDGEPVSMNDLELVGLPTSHWNKDVLSATHRIHSIFADHYPITTTKGATSVQTDNFAGQGYEVSGGGYDYSTFYDAGGHWQGMAFTRGNKGYIEFRCVDCTNMP